MARAWGTAFRILGIATIGWIPASAYGAQSGLSLRVHEIPVRPQVHQPVLSVVPEAGPVRATWVLFPGGSGAGAFKKTGEKIKFNDNFLSRIVLKLAARGNHVLLFNPPSDQVDGMPDAFRASAQHARDVQIAVQKLAEPEKRLNLVGTSRGTLSAATVALKSELPIRKLVLTATVAGNQTLIAIPLSQIEEPIQFIHHEQDGCPPANPDDVRALVKGLSLTGTVELSMVRGGTNVQADPCRPRTYHGFFGIEDSVIDLMSR